jgi:hypothetical protein
VKLAAVAVVAAALASTAAASPARHVVETAMEGSVQAELSYDFKTPYEFTKTRVTIKRNGTVLADQALKPIAGAIEIVPAKFFDHRQSVAVRNLDADGEPEVVLDLYSGGAHCCWYLEAYQYVTAANSYQPTTHVFGNAEYRTADLNHDGLPELVTGDDRFAYVFTDFADSSFPVQILRYRSGRFVDVTRRFPARIRRDARRQWRWALAKGRRHDNAGFLAAWTADQCLLGHSVSAFRQLNSLRRQGRIGVDPIGDRTVRHYLGHLRRFLRRTGYLR